MSDFEFLSARKELIEEKAHQYAEHEEALFTIIEELYDSHFYLDEDRVSAALYYLCEEYGMKPDAVLNDICVMQNFKSKVMIDEAYKRGYNDAMKKHKEI